MRLRFLQENSDSIFLTVTSFGTKQKKKNLFYWTFPLRFDCSKERIPQLRVRLNQLAVLFGSKGMKVFASV